MKIRTMSLGPVRANTHIVTTEDGHTLLIDAGDCNNRLLSVLRERNVECVDYILLTHGHFDHTDGVAELKKHFPEAKVAIHTADAPMLSDGTLSLGSAFGFPSSSVSADIILEGGETLPFGESPIKVVHTPGHTKGSVTYVIDDCMFTGDLLFYLSVGRTDFPGGDAQELNTSICSLFDYDGDYRVYPGHYIDTTLDFERKNNNLVRWKNR